jgi:hypothetical protein
MLFNDSWLRTSDRRINHEEHEETKVKGFREIFCFHPHHLRLSAFIRVPKISTQAVKNPIYIAPTDFHS